MRMIDFTSVAGMSLDNIKIKKADITPSTDTTLKSGIIKGKSLKLPSPAGTPEEITHFGKIRGSEEAAINPYKLTEFIPSYGGANVKAVKYAADITDYSGFDACEPYDDGILQNNDTFLIQITAENGNKAYYGITVEVSDGSDEAYLETFEVYSGTQNLIKDFVFNKDLEPCGNYGSAEVTKAVESVSLEFTTSDERLTKGGQSGAGQGGGYRCCK